MSNLSPAAAALLTAIKAGEVTEQYDIGEGWHAYWERRRVTARVARAQRNGWTVLAGPPPRLGDYRHQTWTLTDAGRAALEAHHG